MLFLALKRQFIRFVKWEFWPMHLFYFPVYIYYIYLALRARSLFFFSAVNPKIWFGGLWGESKWETFEMLPKEYIPFTYLLPKDTTATAVKQVMQEHDLVFPIILKPDIGQRGRRVRKIQHVQALHDYMSTIHEDIILQDYVDYPLEIGVFYYRFPKKSKGTISSIVVKKPLWIRGDGSANVQQLMTKHCRSNYYLPYIEKVNPELLTYVPKAREKVVVSAIGNHARGAMFIDGRRHATPQLENFFDTLSQRIPGFYYGRFDIRCKSFQDLAQGKNFYILELNGVGAEAAHVYDPRNQLLNAYKDVFHHIKTFYKIARMNNARGISYPSTAEGWAFIKSLMRRNVSA